MKIQNNLMTDLSRLQMNAVVGQGGTTFSGVFAAAGKQSAAALVSGAQTMEEMFTHAAKVTGVSVDLLKAVAKAESNFDPNCVSSAGAKGVMQLMPVNLTEYGVTDPFNAEQNILAGAMQLADLSRRYNGDLELILAGYNAGIGNVAKYGGVPPFEETKNYISKVKGLLGQTITVPATASSGIQTGIIPTATVDADQMNQMAQMLAQEIKYGAGAAALDLTTDPELEGHI